MRAKEKYYQMAEECLKSYNMILAHIENIKEKIKVYEENDGVSGISYESEKVSDTHKISKVVEDVAINNITSIDLERKKLALYKHKIDIITKSLEYLTPIEKEIVILRYLKGYQWYEISGKVYKNERHCRRIKNQAINKLAYILYGDSAYEVMTFLGGVKCN